MKQSANPIVSIIITTKNEAKIIGNLLKSLQKQTYKNIEIILVDNNSSDNTLEIAKKYGINIYTFGPERSAQRNYGARKSKGKYLLFLDADMELLPDVVKDCINLIQQDIGMGGLIIPEESKAKNFWEKVKAFERSFYSLQGDPLIEAARFFTKKSFDKVGGFDETITGPEDWDFPENIRNAGFRIGRIKSKMYHYERITSPFSLARKKYYYGLKSYRYLNKNKISILSPKTIYFLRPVFYRNWKRLVIHPILSIAMIYMLLLEQIGGGLGYLAGKFRPAEDEAS